MNAELREACYRPPRTGSSQRLRVMSLGDGSVHDPLDVHPYRTGHVRTSANARISAAGKASNVNDAAGEERRL
jgi:hypothetical protein